MTEPKPEDPTIEPEPYTFHPSQIITFAAVLVFWPVITAFAIAGYFANRREAGEAKRQAAKKRQQSSRH